MPKTNKIILSIRLKNELSKKELIKLKIKSLKNKEINPGFNSK